MTPAEINTILDYLNQLSDEAGEKAWETYDEIAFSLQARMVVPGLVKLARAIASRADDIERSSDILRGDACIRAASLRDILSEAFKDIKPQ